MPPSTIPSTSSAISSPGRRFGSSDQKRRRNGAARPTRHDDGPRLRILTKTPQLDSALSSGVVCYRHAVDAHQARVFLTRCSPMSSKSKGTQNIVVSWMKPRVCCQLGPRLSWVNREPAGILARFAPDGVHPLQGCRPGPLLVSGFRREAPRTPAPTLENL